MGWRSSGSAPLLCLFLLSFPFQVSMAATIDPVDLSRAQSSYCNDFFEPFADEYIVQLHGYALQQEQEQYVSSFLSSNVPHHSLSVRNHMQEASIANLPTDFVLVQLYSCARRLSNGVLAGYNQCYASLGSLDQLHVNETDVRIKRIYKNRALHSSELFGSSTNDESTPFSSPSGKKIKSLIDELGIRHLHDRGYKGKDVRVGVFDTGISSSQIHRVKERINWTFEKTNEDKVGHGTFIASIINGDDLKCPGIAPDADLVVFRMFTSDQLSFTSWFLDAFNYAMFRNIHVINLSTGGPDFHDLPFVEKVQELTAHGIIVVSAVGNSGPKYGTLTNPADQKEVIGVGGITSDGNQVAAFSSRGMTMWEAPFGIGRVKPDLVTLAADVPGAKVTSGCTSLTGTSVSAPIVSASIALLASIVPERHRWELLNPATIKQILVESADRLPSTTDKGNFHVYNHIFEQGSGTLNVSKASAIVEYMAESSSTILKPSVFPSSIDATDCPYMWPLCSQPLFLGSLPLTVNLTLLNPSSAFAEVTDTPRWKPKANGDLLDVSIAYLDVVWPYVGSIGVFIEVNQQIATKTISSGSLLLSIRSPHQDTVDEIEVPIRVSIVPTPPRSKRILWDQFHSISYPSAYVPRDSLEDEQELLDSAGDHLHTNYHQLWNYLTDLGYFLDILSFELTCTDVTQYGTILIVDPEEEFFVSEIEAMRDAVRYANTSLVLFAEWYDEELQQSMKIFDTSTLSSWSPITGGANIPAINSLLKDFHIAFGEGVVSSQDVHLLSPPFANGSRTSYPYLSGSFLTNIPVGGYVGFIEANANNVVRLNSSDLELKRVPILGLYQVPAARGGRIAVFGDSACLDISMRRMRDDRNCFSMLRQLLEFTSENIFPEDISQLHKLDVEYTMHVLDEKAIRPQESASGVNKDERPRSDFWKYSKVLEGTNGRNRSTFCHVFDKRTCRIEGD